MGRLCEAESCTVAGVPGSKLIRRGGGDVEGMGGVAIHKPSQGWVNKSFSYLIS